MHGYCLNLYANLGIETISEGLEMIELKSHLYRLENIKAIHDLAKAGVDHHVISVFLNLLPNVAVNAFAESPCALQSIKKDLAEAELFNNTMAS